MEIKPEYKQTEIGVIPEDWEAINVGKLGSLKNGINKGKDSFGKGYPFVNLNDVFGSDEIKDASNLGLVDTNNHERQIYNLVKGDILFVRSSVKPEGVGQTTLIRNNLQHTVFSGFIIRLRFTNMMDDLFKKYCFNESRFRKRLLDSSSVSANTNINQNAIIQSLLCVPRSILEQNRIAKVLSDIDSLITSLEKLIEKKKLIKQGVMQELLTGKRRLPGFSGEWETKRLGTFCAHITTGRKDVNEGNPNGKYPFYTCSRAVTFSDHYSFDTEAILIAGNGDVGTLHYFTGKFEAYQRTYVLSGFNVNARYLVHYLNMNLVPTLCDSKIGTSIPYIKIGDLINMPVLVPMDDEELEYITSVLDDIESDIDMLELQLYKQVLLKQAMMQELLTGRIRLI